MKHISEKTGFIIAHFGAQVTVETQNRERYTCFLRRQCPPVVVGDQVRFEKQNNHQGVVFALEPRHTVLKRSDKLMAANIDQALIVISPEPIFNLLLLDHMLVMLHILNIKPLIVLNKIDLLSDDALKDLTDSLSLYQKIGYPLILTSAKAKSHLADLKKALKDHRNILIGQSGVGKSSLILTLLPETVLKTTPLSDNKQGKHTTTTAYLYHLNNGGDIIDSPGIREFMLSGLTQKQIETGFIEFKSFVNHCQFQNCRHLDESDCAVKKAVEMGSIAKTRWQHYRSMVTAQL